MPNRTFLNSIRQMGIEQAREWYASDVLQPLMVAIKSAHAEVIAGAAQLGFPGVRLTPLTDLGKGRTRSLLLHDCKNTRVWQSDCHTSLLT
jgi:hypothetical protein